ncbi:MAG TPA: YicC/YloC family endoribonuclease [Gemmatimonadaceae bacterium]|nr:YicC/YloC family endoribonuclease [Gemmatimonadaceae bacterium]
MLRSMTGFGAAEGEVGTARVSVEVRSVNHRFFNPSIKLPNALARWEPEVREALRQRVARGHVTLSARLESQSATDSATIDEAAFARSVEKLRDLQTRFGLGEALDVATVLRVPGVIAGAPEETPLETAEPLVALVGEASSALMKMREAEGARLGAVIDDRLRVVEDALTRIAARAPDRIAAHRTKLQTNVQEIAGGVAVDPQRLAQEIAILAERLDVGEELDRFRSHITAFRETLRAKNGEPVGKRLGFLLQEMLREANTTGSKANDAAMQKDVVAVKEELERIREQVENLE